MPALGAPFLRVRASELEHEPIYHAVEMQSVVKAGLTQIDKV